MPPKPPTLAEFRSFFLDEYERASIEPEIGDGIPAGLLERVAELGAYKLTIPQDLGGFGLDITEYLPYLETAAMGPGPGRMLVHLTNGVWRPLAWYGTREQREIVPKLASGQQVLAVCLTECGRATGSRARSRAMRDGGDWLLTGEQPLTTFADRADWFLVVAATDDRRAVDSLTAFLVPRDTAGFEIAANRSTIGTDRARSALVNYHHVRLADRHRLGEVGEGLEIALSFLDYSRISLSCCMVGLAQRALDEAVSVTERRSPGSQLIAGVAMQAHFADMYADIHAGRALVHRAVALGLAGGDYREAASTATVFCLSMVARVTDRSLKIHHGYGGPPDAPIARIHRAARDFGFEEDVAEVQRIVVAQRELVGA